MSSKLENFCPRLRPGRVTPQGSRIIFEADNPYNQIVLPMALADLILLCSGQFSVREIIEKIYKKQGAVPFRSILTAIHLLHQGGFFENGDQLELSSHLQSWMKPRESRWSLSWRFGQRISSSSRSPSVYYVLTLVSLITSIFGLQYLPHNLFTSLIDWTKELDPAWMAFQMLVCSSAIQTFRYAIGGVQLLLLTSKAYNVSIRISHWGIHLHVGDEANDLFENRLYTAMFHVSQILMGWTLVAFAQYTFAQSWILPITIMASILTFWEMNPFVNSEGRKLLRAVVFSGDSDVASWHFEANPLLNSINHETRRREQIFSRLCALWVVIWLSMGFTLMSRLAVWYGPSILANLRLSMTTPLPWIALFFWMTGVYFLIQSLVEVILSSVLRPYGISLIRRINRRIKAGAPRTRDTNEIASAIESLPLFSHFHDNFLEKIVRQAQILPYSSGAMIIQEGAPSRELFVLLEGEVSIERPGSIVEDGTTIALSGVSVFGESALVDENLRGASVIARTDCLVLRVPVYVIKEVALESQSIRQLEVFRNAILVNQFFASSPAFRSLTLSSIDFLSSRGTVEYFDVGQDVCRQGEVGSHIFLILRGSISVLVHGHEVKILHQGSFFGEISLIANIPRTATIRTREACVFFKISADAFWEVLVQHMDLGVFIETISESRLKEDLEKVGRVAGDSK